MFGKYSYLVYMLIFTIIPSLIAWIISFHFLTKNLRVISNNLLISIVYQLIIDPPAEYFKAWFFSDDKILGCWIINFPFENMFFILSVVFTISSCVLMFIDLFKIRKIQEKF